MAKKVTLFFIILVFFLSCQVAFASLTINEIMYDLSGSDSVSSKSREWIEVYNSDGAVSIDASKWRIYDGGANRTINGEVNFYIPAGGYVIFAGDKDTFLEDHVGFSGTVYDTGITSLNNTGTTLQILDQDGEIVDGVTYASSQGASGDGNSLQKISSTWQGKTATPASVNVGSSTDSSRNNNYNTEDTSSSQSSSTSENKNQKVVETKIKTKITSNNIVFAGIPTYFEASAFGKQGEALRDGRYFWNFGDGDSREVKTSESQKFIHTYFYAGEYRVSLEYYSSYYANTPEASDSLVVKVVPAEILISRVGDEQDFFIELSNDTNNDTDLSNWVLVSNTRSFSFPRNTMLGSKDKLMVSSFVTHFSVTDKDTLKLLTPQGKIAFDYGASVIPVPKLISNQSLQTSLYQGRQVVPPDKGESKEVLLSTQSVNTEIEIPVENLSASVVSNSVTKDNPMRTYILTTVMTVFLGISAGAVYFIRQKKVVSSVGEDFQILDE